MRIHLTSTIWHGNHHGFLSDAFRTLGHEVVFFNEAGTWLEKFSRKIILRLPRIQYTADDFLRHKVSAEWMQSIRDQKSDVVILLDYTWNILPSAIQQIRKEGFRVIYWITSPTTQGIGKDILASAKFSDHVFTIDPWWMTIVFEESEYHFLPLAGESECFHPLPGVKKEYDVAFVGSITPQSWDGFIRTYMISHIPERYHVAIFGMGVDYWYQYFPALRSRVKSEGRLSFSDVNEVYNKSRIMLNLHSASHTTSFSGRTFEIALAGAFQIANGLSIRYHTDEIFPGKLLQGFDSVKEMNALIDHWLPREKERAEIAEKMREIALARHTWRNRAETLLSYL